MISLALNLDVIFPIHQCGYVFSVTVRAALVPPSHNLTGHSADSVGTAVIQAESQKSSCDSVCNDFFCMCVCVQS